MSDLPLPQVLERLLAREDLEPELVERTFGRIFDGELTPAQIAAFAIALRAKGETEPEIAAAARALRSRARVVRPRIAEGAPLLDTCGTGGDGAHTINVSTLSAIVVAACGVTVAKHGNRAISSRAGSADVLEALGLPVDSTAEDFDTRLANAMEEIGIAFLFAPRHHGALRHAAAARRELGVRTVFNLLGPIANPAGATHQLIGVFDDRRRKTLAAVLGLLGSRRAWVVHGTPCEGAPRGLDEVSPSGVTRITELGSDGSLTERELHPSDAGLDPIPLSTIAGGSAEDNARIAEAILSGERSGARTAVVLNAACALVVAGARDLREARERAEAAIDRGDARETLARWRRFMT
ncbi:MAG: anthranilate phosphoribosyltransferase [Polyangiales bacterium]